MQYLVAINQPRALEWGLNAQQAMLFAFLHQVPTWADARQIDGQTFFNISKTKIVREMRLLTDRPDTAYRLMKQLAAAGLIVMTSSDNKTYMRLTEKATTWNRLEGSEKYPTPENYPSQVGEKSEPGSEKSPTNQVTNDPTPSLSDAGEDSLVADQGQSIFERATQQTDDGAPVPKYAHRFPMTLDWQPDEGELAVACLRAGLASNLKPTTAQLAKFTAHHADSGREHGTTAWLAKLVDWMCNDIRAAHQKQTRGGAAHGDAQRRGRAPARHQSAAEARAAARGEPLGDVFDGQYSGGR